VAKIDGITITLDVSKATKGIDTLIKQHPEAARATLFTSSEAILVPAIKKQIRANKSVFRGQMISRITSAAAPITAGNPAIRVGAIGVKYSMIVERGSKPRTVDSREFKKLIDYAKKKMGFRKSTPKRRVRRGGTLTRFNVNAEDVARSIKRSIETQGNKAHPFIMPAFNANKNMFVDDFVRRFRALLART